MSDVIRQQRNAPQHVPPHLLKYGIYKDTRNPFTFGKSQNVRKKHEASLPMPQIELPEGMQSLAPAKRRDTT